MYGIFAKGWDLGRENILLGVTCLCWTVELIFFYNAQVTVQKCCFSVTWNRGWQLTLNSFLPSVSSSSLFGQDTAIKILARARDTPSTGHPQHRVFAVFLISNNRLLMYIQHIKLLHTDKVQSVHECTLRTLCFHGTFPCRIHSPYSSQETAPPAHGAALASCW